MEERGDSIRRIPFSGHLQHGLHDRPPVAALRHLRVNRQRKFSSVHAGQQPCCSIAYDHTRSAAPTFVSRFAGVAARIRQAIRGRDHFGVESRRTAFHVRVAAPYTGADGQEWI